jgi:YD repeat-containing protein
LRAVCGVAIVRAVRTHRRTRDVVLAVLVAVSLATLPAIAQQANVNYVYDELGRLVAVIDQQGDVARYNYDAVGNLLSIERINATGQSGAVAITLVTPNQGKVATTVTLFGKGFSATPSQNAVAFNGTAATVTEAAPNRLVTSVPAGATTGSITLAAPLGNATSPSPFTVLVIAGPLVVTPSTALVLPGRTQQFSATLNGTPTTNVAWSVNGIPGGDSAVGTVSSAGLYTAPASHALSASVVVRATHIEDTSLTASAMATTVVPKPLSTAATVVHAAPPATVDKNLATAGSVVVTPAAATVNNNVLAALSVQNAPAVTGLSPSSATRGTSGLTVTLTGVGFTGATAVDFRLGNTADSNITVSNLSVASDTQLSVTVAVASGAAVGVRVVRVTTSAGASTATGTGSNLFTVQ